MVNIIDLKPSTHNSKERRHAHKFSYRVAVATWKNRTLISWRLKHKIKHNRLNVGRIALERLVGALIKPVSVRVSLNGTKKFYSGLQITTLDVNICHY